MSPEQDIIIIGGGIIGCAAAYYLARRGMKVLVLEQGEVGEQQSSRAWGFVRQQGRHPAEVELAREASALWAELDSEIGGKCGFSRSGILIVASERTDIEKIRKSEKVARQGGLETLLVSSAQIRKMVPGIGGDWAEGLYTPSDGYAEPAPSMAAFAAAATRQGVRIEPGCRVLSISAEAGRVTSVSTPAGPRRAKKVLCAAALGAPSLLRPLGLRLPIKAIRSSVAETEPVPSALGLCLWTPHVACRPTTCNSYFIGNGYRVGGADYDIDLDAFRDISFFLPSYFSNWRQVRLNLQLGRDASDDEPPVNESTVSRNVAHFRSLLPRHKEAAVERTWAGRIDITPDQLPAIGEVSGVEGLYVAAGFSGHGFALSPAVGKRMAELVSTGSAGISLSAFDPRRFETGNYSSFPEAF